MNREKGLFLIMVVIAALWGGSQLLSPYSYATPEGGGEKFVQVPALKRYEAVPGRESLLLKLVAGWETLEAPAPEKGRTTFVRYDPLIPVDPAQLEPPDALSTPLVLPPIDPFPPVSQYRDFRTDALTPVTGGPAEGEGGGADEGEDEGEDEDEIDEADFEDQVLEDKKRWEFVPTEWDKLTLTAGPPRYGKISITKEGRDKGFTKYHLLLEEHKSLPFYFEEINIQDGKTVGSGTSTLESSKVVSVEFADNIDNRYWSRRVKERVEDDDSASLCALGEWVMDLAKEEKYVTRQGLALAVKTLLEAVTAAPKSLECVLSLGEAYHRAFDYDNELRLYEGAIERSDAPSLRKRTARIYRRLRLYDLEERELNECQRLLALDADARLCRGEARYHLGKHDEAYEDFQWVARNDSSSSEQKSHATEGMARVRVTQGKPEDAVRLLEAMADPDSRMTLGAAYYALRRFDDAYAAFEEAVGLDAGHTRARTLLGFAKAHIATDWEGIDEAIRLLSEAREADPLNYYLPPLGQGFAEQRRGLPGEPNGEPRRDQITKSVDHYERALLALPTEPYIHYILGVSYARDGRHEEARKAFLAALKLDYRFVDALIWAGTVSMELGDWAMARGYLKRALDLELRELRAAGTDEEKGRAQKAVMMLHYRVGRAALLSDDIEEDQREALARENFKAIVAPDKPAKPIDQSFAPAYIGLAIVEYRAGKVERAKELLRMAIGFAAQGSKWGQTAKDIETDIRIAENRRIWRDVFDRRDSSTVGNAWKDAQLDGVRPRLEGGEVVINGGRQGRRGEIRLERTDRTWSTQFLSARTRVKVATQEDVTFQFLVFSASSQGATANQPRKINLAAGLERTPRGEVAKVFKRARNSPLSSEVLTDADGNPRPWPAGEVELGVRRSEEQKGSYDLYIGSERVATIDGGPGDARSELLVVGFRWTCGRAMKFDTSVSLVEVVIDLDR